MNKPAGEEPAAAQQTQSVHAFWRQVLKVLAFYLALATIAGWGFGPKGLLVAWWIGATVFFLHFFMLLHERYRKK